MGDDLMVNALRQLSNGTFRSKTARLRDLYDEVERLRSSGVTHAKIIETMRDNGLEFGLRTFEVTLYRIKRERENNLLLKTNAAIKSIIKVSVSAPVVAPFNKISIEKSNTLLPKTGFHRVVEELEAQNSGADPRRNDN